MSTSNTLTPMLTARGFEELDARIRRIRNELLPGLVPALAERERDERDVAEFERLTAEADELDAFLGQARVLVTDAATFDGRVGVGMRVLIKLSDGETCWVRPVHPREAALDEERISVESPLATALMGARQGSTVWVGAPAGVWACEVLEVELD